MLTQIVIAFGIYFFLLLLVGLISSRKEKTTDFALGGRSTNYWVTAIALQASDTSHWLFLAFPGAVYLGGAKELLVPFFLVICMFLNWQFIAPQLRRVTATYKSVTLFSFFEKRFNDTSGSIRVLGATISLIFFVFFIASGPVASGLFFESIFGLSYQTGVFIGLGGAVFYILLGGYQSVAWCNFFQGIFILFVLLTVPIYAYFTVDGWSGISLIIQAKNFAIFSFPSAKVFFHALLVGLGWGIGYFGQPHLFNFFMGINNPKNLKYAKYLGLSWQTLSLISSFSIGLIGIAFFPQEINNPETLFVSMTMKLFLPFAAGLMLCALLAATLTTLNSQILAASSILARDLYQRILQQNANQQIMLWISRLSVLIVAIFAGYIALSSNLSIYDLVAYGWSGIGSSFAPLTISTLYWSKTTKQGAVASMLSGALTIVFWPIFGIDIFPMIPGFISSSFALIIVSLLTQKKLTPQPKCSSYSQIKNKM